MGIESVRDMLLWCTIINYAVLVVWFLVFKQAHGWLFRLHAQWFRVSEEQFDSLHYTGMMVYKIGVLLLNLVPYLALRIVG
jgi:hypothetical protein